MSCYRFFCFVTAKYFKKSTDEKGLTICCKYSSLVIRWSELIRTAPLLQLTPLRCVHLQKTQSPLL